VRGARRLDHQYCQLTLGSAVEGIGQFGPLSWRQAIGLLEELFELTRFHAHSHGIRSVSDLSHQS
jgi:hypothetical protein